jgi:F-type H+-transporting ATPase subunit b
MKARRIVLFLGVVLVVLSASCAFAASEGSSSPWTMGMLIWRVINTIALLALLVWALKKPLVNFFTERKAKIEEDLAEAVKLKEQAEELIKEYEGKIAGMEQELSKMRAELQKAAEAESQKVVANGERMAAAMVEAAQITAEQEVRKAKETLKNEAVTLAIQLAEALIREKINEDDRKRIVDEYLVKVGGMK